MIHHRALQAVDLLAVHRHWPDRWPFLLDSASRSGDRPSHSILLCAADDATPIQATAERPFFDQLEHAWQSERCEQSDSWPFAGGWFVYLGYEAVGEIEPRLRLPSSQDGIPKAYAMRCDAALLVDHERGQTLLIAEQAERLDTLHRELRAVAAIPFRNPLPSVRVEVETPSAFIDGVERIKQYILAGDVFQVNLSRRWMGFANQTLDPVDVYARLVHANAAPFAGLARLPGGTLLSSSPERLVESRNGQVQTRPIAGTRPRGQSEQQDRALSEELLAHPKERAEHVMLIDLERNDLGRVCRPGTVDVDELMILESYAHVHHIVSNVRGELANWASPVDLIKAVFPGGTITGCPKVRCMEIIAELEPTGRSFYTGSMGYLGLDGRLDLNILIRSMLVHGSQLEFSTGAGIVADSMPYAEVEETEAKAAGLLKALA
ncbi:MAG: aminodeoxychorismate synthase component I [Pseudomonadota bacterium]